MARTQQRAGTGTRRQGIFWILTIPYHNWTPYPVPDCAWVTGQLERGAEGYVHWQIVVAFKRKRSIIFVKELFDKCHAELTKSDAACDYVSKEDSRIPGTQFEFGIKPFQRNSKTEWESVWESAKKGDLMSIPANVRVVSYRTLRAIGADFDCPRAMVRSTNVYWGKTQTGKSRKAWEEAGMDAYSKDPRSKFWCGYQGESNVVLDEFRGAIDISHLLRWLDRYPVRVEIKGSSVTLCATTYWITSNIHPREWYPDIDSETMAALLRRLTVTQFH